MNYNALIITRPIRYDEEFTMAVEGQGDSYFISLVEADVTTYENNLPDAASVPLTPKPSVSLHHMKENLCGVATEGSTVDLKVVLSEPSAIDTNVTVDLVFGRATVPEELIKDEYTTPNGVIDWDDYVTSSIAGEWVSVQEVATVLAGDTEATVTFTLNADTVLYTKLRSLDAKITSQDNTDYMINPNRESGMVLVKDSLNTPKWTGAIELWGKTHEITHIEPITDPDTSSTAKFNFGWELDDLSALTDISTLSSHQIDDIPLHSITFKPEKDSIPEDIENTTPLDLTSDGMPYYRAVVYIGRRE